jgi:hypothetical protein
MNARGREKIYLRNITEEEGFIAEVSYLIV